MSFQERTLIILTLFCLQIGVNSFVLEGSQTSYAQFRKWAPILRKRGGGGSAAGSYGANFSSVYDDSAVNFIEFEFLTSQEDGLLLYTDDGGYYDFIGESKDYELERNC